VFAVKDDLVVDFNPITEIPASMKEHAGPGGKATKELELNIVLAPKGLAVNAAKPVEQQ
jgi:catechol 1,2-dioxygenase